MIATNWFTTIVRKTFVLAATPAAFAGIGLDARAQTAMGEIEGRPAPVFRCPGIPCAFPNVFNITVAVQYNAPPADITAIQNMISAMSAVLFDVTDGQAEIGEAFIYNNAFSTAADLRVYPSTMPTWWQANTGNWKVGGSMHVSIDNIMTAGAAGESLAHEFVHLVFDARDEYESRAAGCGALAGGASCPTAAGQTPCLMDSGGDGASSELCWTGNHEPAHVTEHSRCRSNRSCWEQVVWSWPTGFAMPAGVPDPAANGAVVDPTSFIVVNSTVRVVLVLDQSSSMSLDSPSRIERLKVAANDFVSLAENSTEVGIVSFSTDAEAASGHANVAIAPLNAAQRAACTAAITALTPNGWTGIGLGLQKARDMITAAGGVTANTFIVLMTDGINNRPLPDWDAQLNGVLADLLASNIRVLVTCTGGDLGLSSQCAEIAAATGGFSVDSADSADLPQAFTDFHEKISGRENIDSVSGRISTATPKKVFVEAGADSVTFAVLWQDANAPVNLTVIDPANNPHASVPMQQGRFTRLASPMAGEYTMIVTNLTTVPSNSTYVARAYIRHHINSLTAWPRYASVRPGQPMYLYGYPRGVGGCLTDPTNGIAAAVLRPNGQTEVITLFDKGRGSLIDGDDLAGDGIFTAVYTNTSLKGAYRFLLSGNMSNWVSATDAEAAGPSSRSSRFNREVRISAAVGDPNDVAVQRISINEWMASNTHTLTNPVTGQYDDWFELYNPNSVPVNLSGWLLANSVSSSTGYFIPPNYILAAGGYRVVWADGLNLSNQADLHVNFKLGAGGDTIALMNPGGRVVDHVTFGQQTSDVSEGHYPNGGPYVFSFTTATPGAPNPARQTPVLRPTAAVVNNTVVITLNSVAGLSYRVEYRNGLGTQPWKQLAPAKTAAGTSLSFTDPFSGLKQRFYRAVIVQ